MHETVAAGNDEATEAQKVNASEINLQTEMREEKTEAVVSVQKTERKKAAVAAVHEPETVVKNEKRGSGDDLVLTKEDRRQMNYKADGAESTGKLILLIILSVIIPPLAVYLKNNRADKWFWVTLILWGIAFLAFGGFGYLGGLWFIAFVIALLVVLDVLS